MKKNFIFAIILFASAFAGWAEEIPEGTYRQTSVNPADWGECPQCTITVIRETPHIIRIHANNGWVGFAVYDTQKDRYKGTWEWKLGKGGSYESIVFYSDIFYDGNVVTMDVVYRESPKKHTITYRKK